ncbi:hypothetical protein [Deinococcus sedimenti]|uniref:Uncharacterized protein n=1 Tax=Deinococcus sedimenti TaxID=1867090 RepID=A0ABQ2SA30_9DEIO|nr:hypothetical protein [Deinococcus sedimenti]GGS10725.1 hypothetical protein GCM10008960_40930 [Deinococcus sedimenti]
MTTSYPDPARPTPVPSRTVMDFASRLGISRRAAHDLFSAAATHLNAVVRKTDGSRLTVTATDFSRMVALVETLNSVGLTIRQLHRIQQSQNPELWTLLQGSRATEVAAPVVDHHPEVCVTDATAERIELILVEYLERQETLLRQHLSRPLPVHYLPAPVPTPARRVRETQAASVPVQHDEPLPPLPIPVPTPAPARPQKDDQRQTLDVQPGLPVRPLPVPVPARAPSRVPTDWPERLLVPTPARVVDSDPQD